MANRDVNVDNAGLLLGLVDHGVDSDGRFTSLAVANDQLALATTDRYDGVDSHQTGHQWFMNRFTGQDTRGRAFDAATQLGFDWFTTVKSIPQWINHPADQFRANGDFEDFTTQADLGTGRD